VGKRREEEEGEEGDNDNNEGLFGQFQILLFSFLFTSWLYFVSFGCRMLLWKKTGFFLDLPLIFYVTLNKSLCISVLNLLVSKKKGLDKPHDITKHLSSAPSTDCSLF